MKRLFLIIACLASVLAAGTGLKAQEVTITLMPGWTWISIPSSETMDFATALGSFTPAVGDRIKSQWGIATYRGNGEWRGQLSEFYPGYGYKYYSTRQVPVSVTFNAQQPSQQVVVTTDTPQFITGNSAMCGGNVASNDGTYILVKGLCWATHENPTTDDFYEESESGVGTFSISMTELNIATTYYARAYAVTPNGTVYGDQKTFTTRDGIPTVTTSNVTNIGSSWAYSGGNITDNGGLSITARGVCWSSSPNPTIVDSHTVDGSLDGFFTSYITGLDVSTTYYVRAYATTSIGTGYGEQKMFSTFDNSSQVWVDLGLPSGLLWAACNVGADNPTSRGNRFAWAEIQPKSTYNWSTYQYCMGTDHTLTKYCDNSSYGYNGFTDNLTTLLPEDDAATANWGSDWRMPTIDEWEELLNNTTRTELGGLLFTAPNGNSLFLPYTDWYGNPEWDVYSHGVYSSSSLNTIYPNYAWGFDFGDSPDMYYIHTYSISRCSDYSVRAVRCKNSDINVTASPSEGGSVSGGGTYMDHTSCTITATANEDYVFTCWTDKGVVVSTEATYTFMVSGNRDLVANFIRADSYVDLGLPSGTLWATCNVGADSPEEYGDYFAWGETSPKDIYNWSTYQYCMGTDHTLTKYCDNPDYGYHGFIDELPLLPEDDVATASWGIDWCMPTPDQWWELYNYTTVTWVTQNGVHGRCFTASNGNSLFLPAAGYRFDGSLSYAGNRGRYWSNCYSDIWVPSNAIGFCFGSATYGMDEYERSSGFSVRAVRSSLQN